MIPTPAEGEDPRPEFTFAGKDSFTSDLEVGADGLLRVDLILSPRGDDVLSDV